MNLILKIAWRNIQRHRGKSIIIGVILFLGAFLMTVGNGVISGMNVGLQKNVVEGFTGDLVLASDKQESDNVFLEMMGKAVEPINNYKQIDSVLAGVPMVKKWLPVGKNFAMVLNEDGGLADGVYVLGVDMKRYRDFFGDNIKLIQGDFLKDHEPGVLIPTGWRKMFAEFNGFLFSQDSARVDTTGLGKELVTHLDAMTRRTSAVFMGMSADNATTDIRAPVRGIIKYRSLNMIFGNFPIVDIESYRECQGYFSAQAKAAEVKKETAALLSQKDESLDDMFAEDNMIVENKGGAGAEALAEGSLRVTKSAARDTVDLDAGTFNLVLIKLKNPQNVEKAAAELTKILALKKVHVKAIPWNKAIGPIGSMAMLIKGALFVFVMLLFFVAIIIIVNTLSMAAIERTTEIGMMRAVGARKGFIRAMFLGETGMLATIFGGAGIAVGIVVVNIVARLNITTDLDMLQLLYGGEVFRPFLSAVDVCLAVIQLVIVTFIAVIYPIRVAGNITPLDAISRE